MIMKIFTQNFFASKTFSLGFIFCSLIFFSSCARKMSFANSSIVPAATGTVKVKSDKNNNYKIDVEVMHLAPADRLTPPRNVYVVWMVTENNETKNIGQLKSSGGMIRKALRGELETTSPFKPVSVFITAEDDATIQYPGNTIVLNTN